MSRTILTDMDNAAHSFYLADINGYGLKDVCIAGLMHYGLSVDDVRLE